VGAPLGGAPLCPGAQVGAGGWWAGAGASRCTPCPGRWVPQCRHYPPLAPPVPLLFGFLTGAPLLVPLGGSGWAPGTSAPPPPLQTPQTLPSRAGWWCRFRFWVGASQVVEFLPRWCPSLPAQVGVPRWVVVGGCLPRWVPLTHTHTLLLGWEQVWVQVLGCPSALGAWVVPLAPLGCLGAWWFCPSP